LASAWSWLWRWADCTSIGIALATANVTHRAQTHQSQLAEWATPFHQLLAQYADALKAMGHSAAAAHDMAMGQIYRMVGTQAAIMAYSDTFIVCAVVAFAVTPFCFLMTPRKSSGGSGAAY
jgi:DHA2 family multidrug resistance protein